MDSSNNSLRKQLQEVIETNLGAEVSYNETSITVLRKVSEQDLDSFYKKYLELLSDLTYMVAGSRKVVVTLFSVGDEEISSAKYVAEKMREEEVPGVVLHSYTCDTDTGANSKLSLGVMRSLGEETVRGLDVDVRVQEK